MPVARYVTLKPVEHNQTPFAVGTPMALSDEYAAPLVAAGAIQAQAGALPAMPDVPGEVLRQALSGVSGEASRHFLEITNVGTGGSPKILSPSGDPHIYQSRPVDFQPQGKAALSPTANANRHLSAVMPFRWYAVMAKVFNAHGSITPNYNVGIATADSTSDPTLNAETWDLFKWDGSPTVSPPVASNSTPGNQTMGESGWSDPIVKVPKAYGSGTVMGIRSWADVAQNTWFDFDPEGALTSSLDVHGYYMAWKANVNAVLNPSSFLSPSRANAASPPVLLRFFTSAMVRQHLIVSSSTGGGKGDTIDMGWAIRTQRVLNSLGGMAYHFANYSHGGAPTGGNYLRFLQMIDTINPDTVTINVFTLNDPDNATVDGLVRMKVQVDLFIEACKVRGIPPGGRILQTWQHRSGATGGEYSNAKAINSYARTKAAENEAVVFDVAATLSDEYALVGTFKDAADTIDSVHPGPLGHAKLVPVALLIYA